MKKKVKIKNKANIIIKSIFFVILISFLLAFYFWNSEKKVQKGFEEENFAVLGLFNQIGQYPFQCTDENLRSMWEFVFNEDSNNIIIVSDKDSQNICNYSLIYKILANNSGHIILMKFKDKYDSVNLSLYGLYGDFNESYAEMIKSADSSNVMNKVESLMDMLNLEQKEYIINNRTLDLTMAVNEYNSVFKIQSGNWFEEPSFYFFNEKNNNFSKEAKIFSKISFDVLNYNEKFSKPIDLIQNYNIPNIVLTGSAVNYSIINLDDYFQNLGYGWEDLEFSYFISGQNAFIIEKNSNLNHKLNFNASSTIGGNFMVNISLNYKNGTQSVISNNFYVIINGCLDYDLMNYEIKGYTQNLTSNLSDYCFDNKSVMEYYCESARILNNLYSCPQNYYCNDGKCADFSPIFLGSCNEISWRKNNIYNLNLQECFRDPNSRTLFFRKDPSQTNLSIEMNNTVLILIPAQGWIGGGRFNVYANNSLIEKTGVVNFRVYDIPTYTNDENNLNNVNLNNANLDNTLGNGTLGISKQIINPNPRGNIVSIKSRERKNFSIENTDYQNINWYLDNNLVKTNSKIYEIPELDDGNHTLKVEMINRGYTDSKTWSLIIGEEASQKTIKAVISIIITLIIIAIIIIISILVYRIIKNKKSGNVFLEKKLNS